MNQASKTPFLDQFTENLSQKISQKPKDYQVYGREEEIQAVIISLCRRTKNNPILIGEPGVGKTAILEGLALEILQDRVSETLKGLTVRSLELSSLMNESEGSFITKLKNIIDELKKTPGQNLLFIDEFHTVVGAGSQNGESLDAGNVLKPSLSRGEIQLIGATTLDEFHEYIEQDRALERRTQPILIKEPTIAQAIEIVGQAKEIYEDYHNVSISHEAVCQAVKLSTRYIPDRFLPDKAFDLLDEAATIVSSKGQELVTEREIAEVLKKQTGIPVTTVLKGNKERLDSLEEKLHQRVKGQDEAIKAVVEVIKISQAGMQDENKPIGSLLFLGTTGVGKTELSKALAEGLFDDEEALIRFDMSEYSQKGDVTKLIGDRNRRSKGLLTEGVKRKPYSVILLDEIEKAHPDIYDLLLQVIDDGRLTDATGRLVSFKNTIVIMTTNIGQEKLLTKAAMKGSLRHLTEREQIQFEASMEIELKTEFRPEFLNRIEYKVIFNLLEREDLEEIVEKNMKEIEERTKKRGLFLSYDPAVLDYLVDLGTDPKNGARPLERLLKRKVQAPISDIILKLSNTETYQYMVHIQVEGEKDSENPRKDPRQLHFDIFKHSNDLFN
ncbi:ATP-dependent Clp protease ATP-binding subunit [Streptococcus anginosus]|uniref:ATP-dependent Clp protease ATP-binding subunit n=1 Tax=Streptococcus anginosus TaxID=1328 RepID=A0A2T0G5H9_STRAP|nr:MULTISPECIES: ATP-dependent Clp protease ATP-binding subunit [Streptococcus anginosus group]HEO3401846.1 ATP-dependent Clp protease ATP-binding subunit [Streptococcus agalactiae]MED5794096.1 ATP-dependent Clp protease ATP-binding subunit [Streptococcus anginosus]MED5795983.1 ATP-dependent Clp protease ATP-binding subunit [Streptococcus anginosus]MED5885734.1 ATP-dependent Clp protease ATP-binding subunit [Streptococcus anginosus]PRT71319.1 ATP-dependent Clp protease ATP-binding subunit [Str